MPRTHSYQIIRREPEHDDEVRALYVDVFGEEKSEQSRRRWQWQYLDNPGVGEAGPTIWVAVEGSRIIGQLATMPCAMWWGDREVRASVAMDYMVREDVRGRGVGLALANTWADHVDVGLALGLTPSSYPLFRKMFTDVGPVPAYIKVLDAGVIARRRFGRIGGAVAGPLMGAALRLYSGRPARNPAVEVRAVSTISDEYDDLWLRARTSFTTIARRDARFVTWRYLQCPFRKYRILEAQTQGVLSGYIVVRSDADMSFRRGVIIDLFCRTDDVATQDALIDASLRDFVTHGFARADTYCLSRRLGAALRRHGFMSGRTAIQYCVASRHAGSAPLSSRSEWSLMLGDGDLDRA